MTTLEIVLSLGLILTTILFAHMRVIHSRMKKKSTKDYEILEGKAFKFLRTTVAAGDAARTAVALVQFADDLIHRAALTGKEPDSDWLRRVGVWREESSKFLKLMTGRGDS